jgi:hypothetical protein
LDSKICRRCGKEMPSGDREYCVDCERGSKPKKRKLMWYGSLAVLALLLTGTILVYGENCSWDLSWDSFLQRPIAVINDEPVSRSEARERSRTTRLILEKEYGRELFTGEEGLALLADMESDLLEKMVEERLVAQEANRMKITVTDEQVSGELKKIGIEIYGSLENFQASSSEEGISPEYLANHIRNLLLLREVNKAKNPSGKNPEQDASPWLVQARKEARITVYENALPTKTASRRAGLCCGSDGRVGEKKYGGGCRSGQASAGGVPSETAMPLKGNAER